MSKLRLITVFVFLLLSGASQFSFASPFLAPKIGLATRAAAPVRQANNTYNVTYTLVVKNYGDEKLTGVQVTDALSVVFATATSFSVVGNVAATGTLVANTGFNGVGDINLLAPTSFLLAGVQQTIVFTVNVNGSGLYSSILTATGLGTILPVLDLSLDGNNPDPNGDGIPIETSATLVNLTPFPLVGIAKSATAPQVQSNGSYNVTYTITIKNLGNDALKNVQASDALGLVFIGPSTFTVGPVVATGSLIANPTFNGTSDSNLLKTTSTLALGATQTLTFTVNITPNLLFGPFLNTASVTATGVGSAITTLPDLSVDGNDPDPNGDGIPLETSPTTISLIPTPVIGIAKSVSSPLPQPDGSNNVTFTMTVKNLGNEALHNVQVTDALITIFTGPTIFSLVGGIVATGTLTASNSFDGSLLNNKLLNETTSTLAVGATQTITFTLNVKPTSILGPFANTATATAFGSGPIPTIDLSVDGNNPDPNGDGIPLEASPTLLTLIPIPVIGIAKSASAPILQPDLSYNVTFTITIKNLGNEALDNVHVTDALINTFVGPSLFNIIGPVVTSGSLVANANFALGLSTDLLQPGSSLPIGGTQTLSFTVNVVPNGLFGLVANTAIATATGRNSLLPTLDISVDGNNPDPNGDGLPLETLPTIVSFVPIPIIGISKSATSPQIQSNGSYNVTFTMTVQNLGNEILRNVQVTDALTSAFIGPSTYSLVGGIVASGTLTANSTFNGFGITNLLDAANSSLPIGGKQTVVFTVNVQPHTAFGPFLNTAIASANGGGSLLPTVDISVDGNNPDPNGDGLLLETSPTIISLIPVPIIGLAKSASSPLIQPNGSYNVTYTFAVKNMGNEPLTNVQITDNMVSAFAAPSVYTIVGNVVASGSLVANINFNGNLLSNLLSPGSTLAVGATETVTVTLNVSPNAFFGPFLNTATASANGSLLPTIDLSMDGNNPDPNGDGIPLETLPTIISLIPVPIIGIAKSASTPLLQPNGSYNVTYTFHIENLGNETLNNVHVVDPLIATFPAPSTFTVVGNVVTTGSLLANSAFNGNLATDLLASGSTLHIGEKQTISLTLNIDPHGLLFGPFINSAIATAQGFLLPTTDISVDGNNADPNGDGLPLEVFPTTILLTPVPSIGIAKNILSTVLLPDGSYNVTYSLLLKNYGNVELHNISVNDDLSQAFGLAAAFNLSASISTTGGLQAGIGFNGILNTNLLNPLTSVLGIGESQTINYTVNVKAGATFGPFCNSATVSATGLLGIGLTVDVSQSGSDPDPNGNNNPSDAGENTCTPLNLTSHPLIGIAKTASTPALQANGSYNVQFLLTVKNMGNTPLVNVQVTDDLIAALPGTGLTFSMLGTPSVSGSLTANSSFNGIVNKNLLAAGSTLAVGATGTISLSVNILPNGNFGPFFNSSVASAKDANSSATTNDISTQGTDPDPNGNGNPGDSDEAIATSFSLTPNAQIGLAKAASSPVLQSNGSYNITFTFTVENLGNVALTNVRATDNLASVFPSPSTFSIVGTITSPVSLVPNSSYNGTTDINLLNAGSTLAAGAVEHITLNINVMPNGSFGPFFNTAVATGSATGFSFNTSDVSTDGNNADPNNNDNPSDPGEDTPTTIELSPNAIIGVAKSVTSSILQSNGNYVVTFSIVVKNYGNVALNNVTVTDDLTAAFSLPTTFTISQAPSATGSLTANPAFNGKTDTNLLAAGNSLAAGASQTITFSTNVAVNGSFGPFYNSAKASGIGALGSGATSDISASGTNPDPNGNGDPTDVNENDPTPISLTPNPVMGVAKAASVPVIQSDGSYKVTYTIAVKNIGNVSFTSLQVTDNLATAFPAPATFTLGGPVAVSGSLIPNPSYNGTTDTNLLIATNTLGIGVTETITVQVIIHANGSFGPFYNSAVGSATSASGNYSDISASGNNPDPNGNGNPGDPGENDATSISLTPQPILGVAKAASSPVLQPSGSYTITYTVTLKNMGNVTLTNVKASDDLSHAFTAPATFTLVGAPAGTGLLVANPSYNGTSDVNLLSSGIIPVGTTQTVTYTVSVQPNGSFGPFYNSAVGKGTAGVVTYTDISNSGTNPDPNGNGNPGDINEDQPTGVTLAPNIIAGIAKSVSLPLPQADGSYKVTYTLTVENLGNYAINNVQVKDFLSSSFPTPLTFSVTTGSATTGSLIINPSFNGTTDTNLLAAGSKLAVGATNTISFTVLITLNGASGIYFNRSTVTVVSDDNLTTYTDISSNGTNPDPNGNGNPADAGENDPTPVSLTPRAVLGVAKAASTPIQQTDGTFDVVYSVTVENLGNVILNQVQVKDNLLLSFPSPASVTVNNLNTLSTLIVNPGFNGKTDTNLFAAGSTLGINAKAIVNFTVHINANGGTATYYNSAIGSASANFGTLTTTDVSVSGNNTDPNGNGNPGDPGEDTSTAISLSLTPVIGIAKTASVPAINSNGSYDVKFSIVVQNLGNTTLSNISVVDNLATVLPSGTVFSLKGPIVTSGSLVANTSYDGSSVVNLLNASSTLAIGGKETIVFTFNVVGPLLPGPYYNSAKASASNSDNSLTYVDLSTQGTVPDPNGNGNPSDPDESQPTPFLLQYTPVIGIANSASKATLKADGTYDVTLTVTVSNLGNEDLKNVIVLDNMGSTFPAPVTTTVTQAPVSSINLAVDGGYNGKTDVDLVRNGTLAVGKTATFIFKINITPNNIFGVFWNQATASADGAATAFSTTDISDDGILADGDGNGNPGDPDENDPSVIELIGNHVLGIAKTVSEPVALTSCDYQVTYTFHLENFGNSILKNINVIDSLSRTFPKDVDYSVVSMASSSGLHMNNGFNGYIDATLLTGTDALAPGQTAELSVTVTVSPNQNYGPFLNSAVATGVGPGNEKIADRSTDGVDPDPDLNNIPTEGIPTSLTITPVGMFFPQAFSPNGDGQHDTYDITLTCGITANLLIFNRWGDKVFSANNYQNTWNGFSNSGSFLDKPLPEGTYFYVIELSNNQKLTSFVIIKR